MEVGFSLGCGSTINCGLPRGTKVFGHCSLYHPPPIWCFEEQSMFEPFPLRRFMTIPREDFLRGEKYPQPELILEGMASFPTTSTSQFASTFLDHWGNRGGQAFSNATSQSLGYKERNSSRNRTWPRQFLDFPVKRWWLFHSSLAFAIMVVAFFEGSRCPVTCSRCLGWLLFLKL